MAYKSAGVTDRGMKRKRNEDSMLSLQEQGVFCVADGMGGGDDGEFASNTVIRCLSDAIKEANGIANLTLEAKATMADKAINQASEIVKTTVVSKEGSRENGSTVALLLLDGQKPGRAETLHAGDSRIYLFRDGMIKQIGRDHSFLEAIHANKRTVVSPMLRGMITRAVGLDHHVELEKHYVAVRPGDIFLLCSDGLNKMLLDGDIAVELAALARNDNDVETTCRNLVKKANLAGGSDNISVIVTAIDRNQSWELSNDPDEKIFGDTSTDSGTTDTELPGSNSTISIMGLVGEKKFKYLIILLSLFILLVLAYKISKRANVSRDISIEPPAVTTGEKDKRALLVKEMNVAERSGRWQSFSQVIQDTELSNLLNENPVLCDKFSKWTNIWGCADQSERTSPGSMEQDYKTYHMAIWKQARESDLPEYRSINVKFAGDAAERANMYCRLLFEEQEYLLSEFRKRTARHIDFLKAVGIETNNAFNRISALIGEENRQNAGNTAEVMKQYKNNIEAVNRWCSVSSSEPLRRKDIPDIPFESLKEIESSRKQINNILILFIKDIPGKCKELQSKLPDLSVKIGQISVLAQQMTSGTAGQTDAEINILPEDLKRLLEEIGSAVQAKDTMRETERK